MIETRLLSILPQDARQHNGGRGQLWFIPPVRGIAVDSTARRRSSPDVVCPWRFRAAHASTAPITLSAACDVGDAWSPGDIENEDTARNHDGGQDA